ncbi:MAG TPA: LysR family transcriptional regulator [Hyphomicrobiaceae bacterium]|nr:LysR family transcriptional regulator [Hyphomicrobiaceae bacterium]
MRRSDLPNLDDLRAFEATARLGSVRAAADELALTHAAISRRNSRLAEYVGAPLFRREGRGLEPTSAGDLLREACRRSFDDLLRTIGSIQDAKASPGGSILLSCERSVAMRWLIPRLSGFQDANPSVAVHLSVGGGAVEGTARRNVIALRRLDFQIPEGWSVKPLWHERIGPVLAPSQAGSFQDGTYLALGTRTRPNAWSNWLAGHPKIPRPRETRMLDHHFLMVEAACGGLGVGLAPRVIAIDDIDRGRLIAPHGFDEDGTRYGLLWRSKSELSEEAVQLCNWLSQMTEGL